MEDSPVVSKRQALMEHLMELRKVLITCAVAILVAFLIVFYFFLDPIMSWIISPIQNKGITVIYTAMSEALVTKFKVALIAACILASPVVIWQVWGFIKPALYESEKRKFRGLFLIALGLFLLGVTFCYFAIYMLAVDFFLIQGDGLATPMLSIDKYVGFLFGFIVPFGVAFQLPIALYFTTRMGWTNHESLAKSRKYVLLGIFFIAAVLTPPDIVSQVALGVPMYGLYEISILVAKHTKPRDEQLFEDDEAA